MTILFVGNTPADFLADSTSAGMSHNTSTVHRDSNYVPNDISVPVQGNHGNPFAIVLDSEVTDFWVHYRYRNGHMQNGDADGTLVKFEDGAGDTIGTIDLTDDSARAQAYGDSMVNGMEYLWPDRASFTIDAHVELTGGNIVVEYYHNGTLISNATAANTGSKGGVKKCVFANDDVTRNEPDTYFSEIICTDGESTLGWRLACLEPDAVGAETDFTGGHAELGDANLSSAAGADTNGDRVSSNVSAYGGPATASGVRAVVAKCVASRGDTGPANMRQFLRISGTNYDGAQQALTKGNAHYMEVWDQDPNTTAAWDTATLASTEVGVKAET